MTSPVSEDRRNQIVHELLGTCRGIHDAGPIRNRRMLEQGKPDLVVAFPGGAGTANMVRLTEAAALPLLRPGVRDFPFQYFEDLTLEFQRALKGASHRRV